MELRNGTDVSENLNKGNNAPFSQNSSFEQRKDDAKSLADCIVPWVLWHCLSSDNDIIPIKHLCYLSVENWLTEVHTENGYKNKGKNQKHKNTAVIPACTRKNASTVGCRTSTAWLSGIFANDVRHTLSASHNSSSCSCLLSGGGTGVSAALAPAVHRMATILNYMVG